MTRKQAIHHAHLLIDGKVRIMESRAKAGKITWGKVARYVLDMTGRADLADAIWAGK